MIKSNINIATSKWIILSYLLIIFLIALSSCRKCKDDCENGACLKGKCACIEGWEGDACKNQSNPLFVVIDSIKVNQFPYYDKDGNTWDTVPGNEAPDLILYLYYGSINPNYADFISTEVFQNADTSKTYTFTKDFPLKVNRTDFVKQTNLYLGDNDNTNWIYFLGGYYFYLYHDKNEFQRTIELKEDGYPVSYIIYIHYEF